MRLTATALAALLLLPSGPVPDTLASPVRLDLATSYCTRHEDGSCYFPGFRATEVPELVAGRTVTITGVGATMGAASAPKVRGGLARTDAAEQEDPLVLVDGSVEVDGAWSVTMTVPDQDTVNRSGPLRIWFQADGPDQQGVYVLHEISAPVALPRTPDPQPSASPSPTAEPSAPAPQPSEPAPQATGWHRVGTTWFWADERGVRAKGWKRISGSWYFFDTTTAAMATGWVRDGGSWYYLTGSGAMATGWLVVDGRWSLFAPNGAWQHYG
ncbi:hypothetical protein NSA19_08265 [Actinomyces bowdenii]|uniref:hypothetical protein n=1 Tax=Actinomyces bowdenii TaxID=131109 RepID=UPI00214B2C92|nr:hypothetical protein [Actinomyces bowdenii]MCR2052837.1 hypothetical protein [Actinomyces bowdenii]